MNPRLSSSQKSTSFPKEYLDQIKDVFKQNFQERLLSKQLGTELLIDGRLFPEEVLFKVSIKVPHQLSQPSIEISMDCSPKNLDATDRINNCIDAAASFLTEYIELNGEAEFPLFWTPFEFDKKEVFMQYSTANSDLEAEADRLLAAANQDSDKAVMVDYGYESEDALDHVAELLGSEVTEKDIEKAKAELQNMENLQAKAGSASSSVATQVDITKSLHDFDSNQNFGVVDDLKLH